MKSDSHLPPRFVTSPEPIPANGLYTGATCTTLRVSNAVQRCLERQPKGETGLPAKNPYSMVQVQSTGTPAKSRGAGALKPPLAAENRSAPLVSARPKNPVLGSSVGRLRSPLGLDSRFFGAGASSSGSACTRTCLRPALYALHPGHLADPNDAGSSMVQCGLAEGQSEKFVQLWA